MKKRILHLSLCLLMLLFGGCAAHQPGASVKNTADKPFERTGLMAHPGERPEEILVRAHGGDVRAMALVIAGYYFGMEGFPRDENLSAAWVYEASQLGVVHAVDFLTTMIQADQPITERTATKTAMCALGKESIYAPFFKEAGIFDIEARCDELNAAPTTDKAAWSALHQERIGYWRGVAEEHAAEIAMMRALGTRPATKDEAHFISLVATPQSLRSRDLQRYIFYAATTHDIESEAPDWSDARLIPLTNKRNDALRPLRASIEEAIILHATFDTSIAQEIIRRAHAGDSKAMLMMARNYTAGEMGFPRSPGLAAYWLLRNEDSGMAAALSASVTHWQGLHLEWVWKASRWAKENGDSRAIDIAAALQDLLAKEACSAGTVKDRKPD